MLVRFLLPIIISNFRSSANAPAYTMATKEGVIKAVVSFLFRDDLYTAFERHKSRISINDANTVLELK